MLYTAVAIFGAGSRRPVYQTSLQPHCLNSILLYSVSRSYVDLVCDLLVTVMQGGLGNTVF